MTLPESFVVDKSFKLSIWEIKISPDRIIFGLILLLGIIARVWGFGHLPPGLNPDEASIGVDSFYLYKYGVDRFGFSYPVHLIAHGSGQNALYAYLLIPFIAVGGLTPTMVRLPMLIAGIISLPLVYFIARRISGKNYALIAMFLLAISPWHIVLSHWGLESNILPFVFLIGFACLLKSRQDNRWFLPASLFFGLCLYAYGTAYLAVTVFIVCAITILLWYRRVSIANLISGLVILVMIGVPIGMFVLVNLFQWDTIFLGPVSILRLPTIPRWKSVSVISNVNPVQSLLANLGDLISLLWRGTDGLVSNSVEPYGYFYPYTLIIALVGIVLLVKHRKPWNSPDVLMLLSWFMVSCIIGMIQVVNVNRVNLIFIPLIMFVALVLEWLVERMEVAFIVACIALLAGFVFFMRDYHGKGYQKKARKSFEYGLLPALDYAREIGQGPICVTDEVRAPYIFVLFSEKMRPSEYLGDIKYATSHGEFRKVLSLDRYSFGLDNCPMDSSTIYILSGGKPPDQTIEYNVKKFLDFQVHSPKISQGLMFRYV